MTTKDLLFTLCRAPGVSGREGPAAKAARAALEPLGPCERTPLGSLVCRVREVPGAPRLMLTAHLDNIGLIVSYIEESGFLRVGGCGGIDRSLLLAARVVVHGAKGDYPGVVCTIPPHLNPDEDALPKLEDIAVDVGFDGGAAREKIAPGDRVSFCFEPRELLGGQVCSGSLDDRAGCAAVILAAGKLAAEPLACSLSVMLATMEESGGQGARTAANLLAPTHAVAVDVSFGHTPDAPRPKCGLMGKGPMIGISPILDNRMFEGLKKAAGEAGIAYQTEVMGGNTGTDADAVAVSGAGVRCALVSIPQRYMHTPVEVVSLRDVEQTAELIAAYVKREFGGDHTC